MSGTPIVIEAITQAVGGTQAAWNNTNVPVPSGLFIYAPDTTVVKVGDGVNLYQNLPSLGTLAQFLAATRPGYSLVQFPQGAQVQNGPIYFVFKAPSNGTIVSLDYLTGVGSFVISIFINDVPVGNLQSIQVNNTNMETILANTGANTVVAGDQIVGVITNCLGSPTDAVLNLNLTWSN